MQRPLPSTKVESNGPLEDSGPIAISEAFLNYVESLQKENEILRLQVINLVNGNGFRKAVREDG